MTSNNLKIFVFLMVVLYSCNPNKDEIEDCIADVPPYLSSIVEGSQLKNLDLIIADLSNKDDKDLLYDYYDILIIFSEHLSNLVEKNGGVRIKEFTLANSCKMPSDEILKSHQLFLDRLQVKSNNFKENYKNSKKYKDVLSFLDYNLNTYLLNKNATLSLNNIKRMKMGFVMTRLLLIQSSLSSYEMEVVLPMKLKECQ